MDDAPQLRKAKTIGVSDWFGFDWQYIVDLLRIPFVKEASSVIVAMPALANVGLLERLLGREVPHSVWATWVAALLYIGFFVLGYLSCPRFIKEYRDFSEYQKRSHSSRFIGWELSKAFNEHNAVALYDELEEKGLAKATNVTHQQLQMSDLPTKKHGAVVVYGPNNLGVDLYTYFVKNGRVLELKLTDEAIDPSDTTQRNLFWVVFSGFAKSRTLWRFFTWVLFWLAVVAYIIALSWNVLRALG
jgi:hypothetical protein